MTVTTMNRTFPQVRCMFDAQRDTCVHASPGINHLPRDPNIPSSDKENLFREAAAALIIRSELPQKKRNARKKYRKKHSMSTK